MRGALFAFTAALAVAAATGPAHGAGALPRVAIETSEGTMIVVVETKRAPISATNFLRYVDTHRLDGATFYRAARAGGDPGKGLIQGGLNHDIPKTFLPIRHEPTNVTGLRHVDGTLSMARNEPGSAMADFFITLGPAQFLDARPGVPGYAAFGHVVSGMAVAKRILAKPTFPGGFTKTTLGQSLRQPVRIVRVRRVD